MILKFLSLRLVCDLHMVRGTDLMRQAQFKRLTYSKTLCQFEDGCRIQFKAVKPQAATPAVRPCIV